MRKKRNANLQAHNAEIARREQVLFRLRYIYDLSDDLCKPHADTAQLTVEITRTARELTDMYQFDLAKLRDREIMLAAVEDQLEARGEERNALITAIERGDTSHPLLEPLCDMFRQNARHDAWEQRVAKAARHWGVTFDVAAAAYAALEGGKVSPGYHARALAVLENAARPLVSDGESEVA